MEGLANVFSFALFFNISGQSCQHLYGCQNSELVSCHEVEELKIPFMQADNNLFMNKYRL
jgi:hypothetical protein